MSDTPARNVLFVVMDTVRKDHLSVYDDERETTPGLETFAEEAAVYDQAVAPAPWTLPSHASMFTGRYPGEHNATQENPYLEGHPTLAQSLTDHRSSCYSSNAWITPYTHLTDGFDSQDNFFEVMPGDLLSGPLARVWKTMNDNERLRQAADWLVNLGNEIHEFLASGEGADSKTPAVIDRTIEFIDDTDEPFFSFINLMDAHLPYHPPEEHKELFAPGVDSTQVCQNSKEYNSGARDISEAEWNSIRGLYDAEIHHVDAQLHRLFEWMRANDEWEDTLVIVCADHGELHGEHGLYGHEFAVYDPIVNVPLLVKHPDLEPGRRDEQVELADLYHTVLDHADARGKGLPLDRDRSLLSESYREFDGGENAFVEYHRPVVELNQLENKASAAGIELDENSRFYSRMRAARRPDGKYIHNERIADEAYRLDSDPDELADRTGDEDPVIAELESALSAFEHDRDDWGSVEGEEVLSEMGDDAKQRLEDLGYID
ncbi:sulfatase-like hydrolase/transferase [Halococcus thailandensis]|uniref:Sulfatase n=1 Tax=Halococcus thailandensis JCM 13552 TaxID=1227457 RepID=M0N4N8_9EURY|nr:sulfatase-like hydrolase/transferase [Halococcus thailandensis]EMA52902.1 sulfatase [Halococcus thailandensis JCM 13552]